MRVLCVSKLCVSKLCVRVVWELCVRVLCVGELCVSKLCVGELCVSELRVRELCVCVGTICTDVKLPSGCSVLLFFGSTISSFNLRRGMECASDVSIQRRRICCTVIWIGDAQSTYLLNLFHFRQWRPAKPSTGMSFDFPFLHYGLCCIRTFLRASFPIGFKPLYGFRNLIYC